MARLRGPSERPASQEHIRSVPAYAANPALATHARGPVPEADGSGRRSQKFKNSIV